MRNESRTEAYATAVRCLELLIPTASWYDRAWMRLALWRCRRKAGPVHGLE